MLDRIELRARNPVASCLMRQLVVPRIYFDVSWPGMPDLCSDVLALDRDGRGDAHLVEIRRTAAAALAMVPSLLRAQAPFRWIAFLQGTEDEASAQALISQDLLYPTDSPGRIGVIDIVEMTGNNLGARVRVKAERFPSPTYELAAKFAAEHQAAIQYPGD